MHCSTDLIEYKQTGYFSKLATDYIAADNKLQPFYEHPVSIDGIKASIRKRKQFNTDRKLLHDVLLKQYSKIELTALQQSNLDQLLSEDTFTITTAHQPNIFTGPLFFIYKILHAIKLAEYLRNEIPGTNFVPVYYMGSEDADLDELGHIYINGEKHEWKTSQTGAVGRMKVDDDLIRIIDVIEGQMGIQPFGNEIISLLRNFYKTGTTIENATFRFVNELFAEFGLLILLPDNPALKNAFSSVIEKELTELFSHKEVAKTVSAFLQEYKIQTSGRELNLFYLTNDKRERIEFENSKFKIQNSKIEFSESEIIAELKNFPERFSPNVILRPVLQETLLPNVVFIGGGGEIAYWLELKKVFEAVNVPYPVLVIRNSFLLICEELKTIADKLRLSHVDLFRSESDLINSLVKAATDLQLSLDAEKSALNTLYEQIQVISLKVDITLQQHTKALQEQALKKIAILEKKMLRAEKRKFEAEHRQLIKLKKHLFPNCSLQERIDNFIPYYAKHGKDLLKMLYGQSLALDAKFTIIEQSKAPELN